MGLTNQWTKKPQYPSGLSTARDCLLPTFLSLPSLLADSIMHSCVSTMHSCVSTMHSCVASLIPCSCCRPQGNLKTIPFRRHQVRPGALCGRAHYEACPPHIQCPPEAQGPPHVCRALPRHCRSLLQPSWRPRMGTSAVNGRRGMGGSTSHRARARGPSRSQWLAN